jgi:hypothetical protein
MSLDRRSDKMIAERKERTTNRGKGAIEMALQRIASVAKILRKGAIVMLRGRSQLNENFQGDECILQQISALRRENRFLKVGLIFCLVLSALPYLTGFQPTVIRASKVVTEWIEFVSGGKTVASIVVHPNKLGLVVEDENAKKLVFLGKGLFGGWVGVYNRDGQLAVDMSPFLWGGSLTVYNDASKPTVSIQNTSSGGMVSVANDNGKWNVTIRSDPDGGRVEVYNKDGKLVWSAP